MKLTIRFNKVDGINISLKLKGDEDVFKNHCGNNEFIYVFIRSVFPAFF